MKNSKVKAVLWVFVILSLALISALSLSALGELPEGATAKGHITKLLDGSKIVDTNWGYYAETKTLYLKTVSEFGKGKKKQKNKNDQFGSYGAGNVEFIGGGKRKKY